MPRKRKTEGMSAQTIHKWLRVYLAGTMALIDAGKLHPEEGKRVVKGLRYSIKALEDSYARYKADQRAVERAEYEDALRRAEAL